VALLKRHLDPALSFWTFIENKPRSMIAGAVQRRRGVKRGLPDLFVCCRRTAKGPTRVVVVELKSRAGLASKQQKEIRFEMLPAGVKWWMARSPRAVMMALKGSGVPFRHPYATRRLDPWEGPFADPSQRLPQHPVVRAKARAALERWKARQRERKAAMLPADARGVTVAPGAIASPDRGADIIALDRRRR
jgi:hypothetical protein